jgi:hypothetical protein
VGAAAGLGATGFAMRRWLRARLERWTRRPEFSATPPLLPHRADERARVAVARGGAPADNLDGALERWGGLDGVVGVDDVVLIKVAAQWWNQGMTNVAAARRLIERVLARPGFRGEVLVFENTHFRLADGSGLARAWTRPSERNVDVPGWTKLGDLIPHFAGRPVSFVGLVDAGASDLAGDGWHDPGRAHGVYGGDGRGPIPDGDARDGYHWDFGRTFRLARSRVSSAQTPLTWPRFTSPASGLVVDLQDGVHERAGGRLVPVGRKLTWLQMVNVNEHVSTGMTACCKSLMGVVDMSAGRMGSDPRVRDYQSVHYFGHPDAPWRMAGPLAHFARSVRAPDLYLAVAEWVAAVPRGVEWNDDTMDPRMEERSAHRLRTVVVGTDPVAVDWWCAKNLLHPIGGAHAAEVDLADPDAKLSRFLRYYREVAGGGVMQDDRITVTG